VNRPLPRRSTALEPDDTKLAELMLYVARRSEADLAFGATKLNKILFFADFLAYVRTGHPITGQVYQKLEHGPAPRRLLPVRNQLLTTAAAALASRDRFGRKQECLVALREPDLARFSGVEIAIVDEVIALLADHDARAASELSHRFLGWQLAALGEDIPYESALIERRPLTEAEEAHARTVTITRSAN
jgi:hypothetical protein